jgi:hypothetical protein
VLTENSYLAAVCIYVGAALLMLSCLTWWLRRRWRAGWIALLVLVGAALLLTPAYPREGVGTLAPALVVAGFQFFTAGFTAAEHALRPLAATSAAAVGLAVLLRLTLLRPRPARKAGEERAAGQVS